MRNIINSCSICFIRPSIFLSGRIEGGGLPAGALELGEDAPEGESDEGHLQEEKEIGGLAVGVGEVPEEGRGDHGDVDRDVAKGAHDVADGPDEVAGGVEVAEVANHFREARDEQERLEEALERDADELGVGGQAEGEGGLHQQ